jgi:DNA-binding FadR family transcriptional regulator
MGMSRKSARDGLRQLQTAGLVSVKHSPGKALEVTLLDRPADVD